MPEIIPTAVAELSKLLDAAVAPAGNVTAVLALAVKDWVNAPACVTLPAKDSVPVPKVRFEPEPEEGVPNAPPTVT